MKEKTFKTFRTAFSYQSCMSMASVKVYFLTRIETEVDIASKLPWIIVSLGHPVKGKGVQKKGLAGGNDPWGCVCGS